MSDIDRAFNAAINFALDECLEDGLLFLSMWREGDWNGISEEFPLFDLGTAAPAMSLGG